MEPADCGLLSPTGSRPCRPAEQCRCPARPAASPPGAADGTAPHTRLVFYLIRVNALGHGPRADHVVHDPLRERLGHLVQLHELPDVVQHVVVLGGGGRHLLDDGGHVPEDGGVQER